LRASVTTFTAGSILDEQQLLERTVRAAVVDVDDLERAAELLEHLVEPGVQARDGRGLVEDRDDDETAAAGGRSRAVAAPRSAQAA